ncbi:hypothetical protein SGUI_1128 [Serinicoccus hydrothermalis]|uniref:RNA polymerase sigma-70 region 4 domain-containing protein n=1 Tax=Serinicoccus hydrothermalis TaxID=1758689 RepID=A0A1B1NAU4_9MICO|nr:sigma factor-like helix-turn-helix DNA-binding protein [Serinicoccus hydrothermalis]ANS78524.1 hypothetical protein SGUI_1128 [Serinicoccus hydrothermalis]
MVPTPRPGWTSSGRSAPCRRSSGRWWCCATSTTLTVADTARTLGLAEGTVKSHQSRALAALRISEHLDDDHVASEGRGH